MYKYFLILLILALTSCKDESSTMVYQEPELKDAGGDTPIVNLPDGWSYVQYGNFKMGEGEVITNISFRDPCILGLSGNWRIINFQGAFFRAEGTSSDGRNAAEPFNGSQTNLNFTDKQLDSFQGHSHFQALTYNFDNPSASVGAGGSEDSGEPGSLNSFNEGVSMNFSSTYGTPLVGKETRPVNYTMRVWKKDSSSPGECALLAPVMDTITTHKKVVVKNAYGDVLETKTIIDSVKQIQRVDEMGKPIYKTMAKYNKEELIELVKKAKEEDEKNKIAIDDSAIPINTEYFNPEITEIIK